MVVSFIGGGNWSTRRKPPICDNVLVCEGIVSLLMLVDLLAINV